MANKQETQSRDPQRAGIMEDGPVRIVIVVTTGTEKQPQAKRSLGGSHRREGIYWPSAVRCSSQVNSIGFIHVAP